MKKIILLSTFLSLSFSDQLGATDVLPDNGDPNYSRLQTVVRLKSGKGDGFLCCTERTGLEVMFETREVETNKFAWAGTVSFRPNVQVISGSTPDDSQVEMRYTTHPTYFSTDRKYGRKVDLKGGQFAERDPLKLFDLSHDISPYKNWLELSFFEWTLPKTYSINDVIDKIGTLKMSTSAFPKYISSGYSPDGKCLNCVTFSMVLLEAVGVELIKNSTLMDSYLSNYKKRTWGGFFTQGLKTLTGAVGTTAGGTGGIIVFEQVIEKGAVVGGCLGGPVGAAIGIGVGAVSVGVGVVSFGLVSYYVIGALEKNGLDNIGKCLNAASAELFVNELLVKRNALNFRIVQTRDLTKKSLASFVNETSQPAFTNWGLRKLLSVNASQCCELGKTILSVFQNKKLDRIPDDGNFVNYSFTY